jgi:putative transcriptional regulator
MSLKMSIANKLKLARVSKGDLTQQELADRVGCSRQTIHSIESGKFVPSVELALKLSRVLEMSVEEIFILEEAP